MQVRGANGGWRAGTQAGQTLRGVGGWAGGWVGGQAGGRVGGRAGRVMNCDAILIRYPKKLKLVPKPSADLPGNFFFAAFSWPLQAFRKNNKCH